jgi:pimeloyl-ACP methyl ester carboxylesterase
MADHFVHMDDHIIEGVGHWLHAQSPDEFYEVTAEFLT